MYVSPIDDVVREHRMQYHQYADDLMLYTAFTPPMFSDLSSIAECPDAVSTWFMKNTLLLNGVKTEAEIFGTRQRLASVDSTDGVNVAGCTVQFFDALKLLGATLDSTLSFDKRCSRLRIPYTRVTAHSSTVTLETTKAVAVSIIGSRLY